MYVLVSSHVFLHPYSPVVIKDQVQTEVGLKDESVTANKSYLNTVCSYYDKNCRTSKMPKAWSLS
jgi:hypothetical protein